MNQSGSPYLYCSSRCLQIKGLQVGAGECSLPGCVNRNFYDPAFGTEESFCSEDHRLRAGSRQLGPIPEAGVERVFTGIVEGAADEFRLMVLKKVHPDFSSIKEQFLQKWQKDGELGAPRVEKLFKIMVPNSTYRAYEEYKNHALRSYGPGYNLKRRFHGTSCTDACDFFVNLGGGPCSRPECAVCSICQHGFLVDKSGQTARATSFGLRYGEGLYFSSVSGKSHDYAGGSEKKERGRKYRAILLCNVVVGRAFLTTEGSLVGPFPRPGYDSTVGEVGPNLNYDEVVVYQNEAAIPAYLITYSLPA
jgi:hypothetical protein